jgi:hypothetical protein
MLCPFDQTNRFFPAAIRSSPGLEPLLTQTAYTVMCEEFIMVVCQSQATPNFQAKLKQNEAGTSGLCGLRCTLEADGSTSLCSAKLRTAMSNLRRAYDSPHATHGGSEWMGERVQSVAEFVRPRSWQSETCPTSTTGLRYLGGALIFTFGRLIRFARSW